MNIDMIPGTKKSILSLVDITERKKAEKQLKESEKRYRTLFESAKDGIFIEELSGEIIDVNQKACEILGYTYEELTHLHVRDIVPPELAARQTDFIRQIQKNKAAFTQAENIRKDGTRIVVGMSATIVEIEGKPRVMAIVRDITDRRQMEEELKKYTKELERANRDLEDYTSTVSHDLKAPLRSAQAFSTLLLEDYANKLDEAGRGYVEMLKDASERMNTLIEDLLTLSRIGRKFTEIKTIDLNELLEEIKTDLKMQIEERGGEVIVMDKQLPSLSTQKVWMKELFMNLIDNGLKFNKSEVPKVEVSCEERDKEYLFKVRDNGIGIEEEYLSRIFDLSERLHSSSEYKGTGIGLTICKKIIEQLGGSIQVESTPGKGSTFSFTIPIPKG